MSNAHRRQEIKDLARAFGLSLLVHAGFVVLLYLGAWNWPSFSQPVPTIRATLVDMAPIIERREAEQRAEEEQQRREEEERQAELERQRQAETERRLQEERERQRRVEERRREQELERQRRADEEQRRIERERREAEQARQRELEELRRQREEAERRRLEEEERLRQIAEAREREEAERRAAEEAERLRLAREQAEAAARQATLREEYILTIQALVTQNWIRHPTTNPGVRCDVRVFQIPGGEIISTDIASPCNADEATRRSIIAAVMRTGELPYRGYESVFQREIIFTFSYDG